MDNVGEKIAAETCEKLVHLILKF